MSDQPQVLSGTYRVGAEIGRGSFANVYKGQHILSKAPVAIKSVQLARLNKKLLENLEYEITILKKMSHPHIVALIDCHQTPSHFFLIMEYCSLGDLSYFFKRRKEISDSLPLIASLFQRYPSPPHTNGLHEDLARHFLKQLASALEFLRKHQLVHRDIKPQNLLLCPPKRTEREAVDAGYKGHWELPVLKLADFGFARILPSTSMAETLCGSPLYMAPEILRLEKYTAKADLWSVGAVLFEMVAGRPPFRASTHVNLLSQIEQMGDTIEFPEGNRTSPDIKRLVRSLLKKDATQRMGFAEFFSDPVLSEDVDDSHSALTNKPLDQSFLDENLYISDYIQLGPSNPRHGTAATAAQEHQQQKRKHQLPPASNRPHQHLTEVTNWQEQASGKPILNRQFNAPMMALGEQQAQKQLLPTGNSADAGTSSNNNNSRPPAPPTPPHSVPRILDDAESATGPLATKDLQRLDTRPRAATNTTTLSHSPHSTHSTSSSQSSSSSITSDRLPHQQQPHTPKSYSPNTLPRDTSPSPGASWLVPQHNKRRTPQFMEENAAQYQQQHHHHHTQQHLTNLDTKHSSGNAKVYTSSGRSGYNSSNNSNTSLGKNAVSTAFGASAGAGANGSNNAARARTATSSSSPSDIFSRPLESEYVVVEKRAVEVNSFADELTHSPSDHKPSSRNNSMSSQSGNNAYQNQQYQNQYNQQQQQLQHRRNSSTRSSPGSAAVAVAMAAASAAAASAAAVAAVASGGSGSRRHRNSSSSSGSSTDHTNAHYYAQQTPVSPSSETISKVPQRRLSIVYGSSPSNALSRALSMASARLFGTRVAENGDVLATTPPQFSQRSLPSDAEEKRFVRHVVNLATKAKAISIFAEVKYSQLLPSSGNSSSDVDLSPDAMVVVAKEALVLYLKTLSLLSRIMKETSFWWKSQGGGAGIGESPLAPGSAGSSNSSGSSSSSSPSGGLGVAYQRPLQASKKLIEQVQWIRDKFNESLEKAEYAQMQINQYSGSCSEAISAHCATLTAAKLIFDRALEMSRSAAMSEAASIDLEGSEISYGTAIWMLQALMEPDDDESGTGSNESLDASDRNRVLTAIDTISHRLQVVRRKMTQQQQQQQQQQYPGAVSGITAGPTPTGSLPRSSPHSPSLGPATTCPSPTHE